jgi:flagellar motor switch protein FliM
VALGNAAQKAQASAKRVETPQNLKRLDLTGRERRLRGAMQAMARVAANFARSARRSMPFLVKRRSRLVPGAVVFVDLNPEARAVASPVYEVVFEEPDGPARASLFFSTDAVAVMLEGALGGAGASTGSSGLGSALSVAQSALVTRIVKQLTDDFILAVKAEVGVEVRVQSARAIAMGDDREAGFGDGLGVDCLFDGLGPNTKIVLAMGAEALEAAIKDKESEDPALGDPRFAEALCEVPIEVVAELGRVSLGLRRLLTLQPGQILRLSTAVDDAAVVRVAGVTKFTGSPVISRGQLAIQIKARHED